LDDSKDGVDGEIIVATSTSAVAELKLAESLAFRFVKTAALKVAALALIEFPISEALLVLSA
jgi:hypothetical protein